MDRTIFDILRVVYSSSSTFLTSDVVPQVTVLNFQLGEAIAEELPLILLRRSDPIRLDR